MERIVIRQILSYEIVEENGNIVVYDKDKPIQYFYGEDALWQAEDYVRKLREEDNQLSQSRNKKLF